VDMTIARNSWVSNRQEEQFHDNSRPRIEWPGLL
jgi:hypothetical protein